MMRSAPPLLGLTVMPEYVQVEGIDRVIENVLRAGATAVCTAPAVTELADEATGAREPPSDAGAGSVRTLDRPLWGQTALFIRTAPSFAPNRDLYGDGPYVPPPPQALTDREGFIVRDFLKACKRAGIETQFQLMAAAPPAYRVQWRQTRPEDEPLTAWGSPVTGRVDANLTPASPGLRSYMRALIIDLVANYPELDAIRFDWPEFPPYAPDSLLFDFNPFAIKRGQELGHDAEKVRADVVSFCRRINAPDACAAFVNSFGRDGLTPDNLEAAGLSAFFAYRSALVVDYVRYLVDAVRDVSGGRLKVHLQGFPPPLNHLSGFDIAALDGLGCELGIKLYTMHWPMIERAYAARLAGYAGMSEHDALCAVRRAFRFTRAEVENVADVHYPEPNEPHRADDDVIGTKLRAARKAIKASPFWALAHGYGPTDDVLRRLQAAFVHGGGRVHMNRYGYLSDEKLGRIGSYIGSEQAAAAVARAL
jgi:hypothetical protein